jgi:hypothetical protein
MAYRRDRPRQLGARIKAAARLENPVVNEHPGVGPTLFQHVARSVEHV